MFLICLLQHCATYPTCQHITPAITPKRRYGWCFFSKLFSVSEARTARHSETYIYIYIYKIFFSVSREALLEGFFSVKNISVTRGDLGILPTPIPSFKMRPGIIKSFWNHLQFFAMYIANIFIKWIFLGVIWCLTIRFSFLWFMFWFESNTSVLVRLLLYNSGHSIWEKDDACFCARNWSSVWLIKIPCAKPYFWIFFKTRITDNQTITM